MPFITSKDGTKIAYEVRGIGPALLLVDGAMCSRDMGPMPAIADALSDKFSVWIFDRRGRGGSGNNLPWTMEKEIDDITALLDAMGDNPMMFGISSGALLAARAAAGGKVTRLALFEAPMIVDGTHPPMPADFVPGIERHVANGKPSEAAKDFMRYVGMPGIALFIMSMLPFWKKVTVNAHTLPYDLSFVEPYQAGKPLKKSDWADISMPVLVMDGGKSPTYMRNAQKQWADILPDAQYKTLPGQTHNVKTDAIAPELRTFFS